MDVGLVDVSFILAAWLPLAGIALALCVGPDNLWGFDNN
jgi:hypothetical protein